MKSLKSIFKIAGAVMAVIGTSAAWTRSAKASASLPPAEPAGKK